MILAINTRARLIIADLAFDGIAGLSPDGEFAFPYASKRNGEYAASIDYKDCRVMIDGKRWSRAHPFLYGRQID